MAKNKTYEDSHFEEYFDTQKIVDIDIEKRMKEAFIDYAENNNSQETCKQESNACKKDY